MRLRLFAAFLLLSVMLPSFALAWIDPLPFPQGNWQYRTAIAVNNSGSALTDYQVAVNTTSLVYNNTGLVGSWHFSENYGASFADGSGNGNAGTYNGETLNNGMLTNFALNASSGWVDGKYGKALVFDGSDDFVNVGGIGIGGANTREFWFKPNNVAGNTNQYFMDMGGNSYWVQLYDVDGDGKLEIRAGGASSTFVNGVREFTNTSEWHHVAVTVTSGGTLSIYVDGTLDASGGVSIGTPGALYLGRYSGAGPYYLNGIMDNVRIYNRALSASEIQQLYQNNTFIRNGLAAYWRFDEGSGTAAYDTHHIVAPDNQNGTRFGNALTFDGVNDYVDISDFAVPATGTLEMWIRPDSAISSTAPYMKYLWSSDNWLGLAFCGNDGDTWDQSNKGKLCWKVYDGTYERLASATAAWNAGQWYHVAATWGSSGAKMYVNGAQEASDPTVKSPSNTNAEYLGWETAANHDFNGTIDEVRIYNRSLSAQEIQQLYNASKLKLDYGDLRFSQPYAVYETPIAVSGTGTSLTDYQVLVSITNITILSRVKADGSDLRFFGSQTPSPYSQNGLPFWIESINSTQARVWVKTNVSSAGSTVYMYYGNPAAQAMSNGSATFDFFDGFNRPDSATVGNGWTDVDYAADGYRSPGAVTIENNRLKSLYDSTAAYPVSNSNLSIDLDFYVDSTHPSESGITVRGVNTYVPPNYNHVYVSGYGWVYSKETNNLRITDNNAATGENVALTLSTNTWYSSETKIAPNNSLEIRIWQKGSAKPLSATLAKAAYSPASAGLYMRIGTGGYSNTINIFDDVRVRKYASPEPAATVGAESVKSSGNEALLNYWQESDSRAWVKAGSMPAGVSTVYTYYGNPNATSAGNASATLDYYDDFSADKGWTFGCSGTVSGGVLTKTASGCGCEFAIKSPQINFSQSGYRIEFDSRETSSGSCADTHLLGVEKSDGTTRVLQVGEYFTGGCSSQHTFFVPAFGATCSGSASVGTWYTYKGRFAPSGGTVEVYNTAGMSFNTAQNTSGNAVTGAYRFGFGYFGTAEMDNLKVSKYASPEPTLSLQQEELRSPALFIGISPAGKTTYPSYNETFTLWVYNNQTAADGFTLSCSGTCSYSENPVSTASYQNKSVTVTITSANASGTTAYTITATSQANSSNYASVTASLTVDTTKWRDNWTDAYGNGFRYRIPIAVSNNGSALTDYQVNFTMDTLTPIGLGRMRSDCGDMRITNGTNELPYWVESGCNTTSTKIWARVPYVPAGNSTLYAYYGNPGATYNNSLGGVSTFDWFEDFQYSDSVTNHGWSGTSIIPTSAQVYGGSRSIAQGVNGDTSYALAAGSKTIEYAFYDDGSTSGSYGSGCQVAGTNYYMYAVFASASPYFYVGFDTINDGCGVYDTCVGTCGTGFLSTGISRTVGWHRVVVKYNGTAVDSWLDGTQIRASTATTPLSKFQLSNRYFNGNTYFAAVRVRKYASPEPAASAGIPQSKGYVTLVRRCGAKQANATVTAYQANASVGSCVSDSNGICSLMIGAGTYDLRLTFADNSTAWKNGTAFG